MDTKVKRVSKIKPRDKEQPFAQPDMDYFKKKLADIFIPPVSTWNPLAIRSAIDTHDNGNFNRSGRLCDAMMRDARIQACINTLDFKVLGLPFEWKWFLEDSDGGKVEQREDYKYEPTQKDLFYLDITKKFWAKLLEACVPTSILKNIINMGFSIFSRNWELEDIDGIDGKLYVPNIHIFHPSNIWYQTGLFQYYVTTYNRGTVFIDENDERFQIVKHIDMNRPWMQGAVRSVGFVWMDKWMALADWRAYLGIHGNPIRKLTTDRENSTPPDFDIEQFIINLAISHQYGQPVHLIQGQTLELLQANPTNVDVFLKKIEQADKEIAINYLGQNLTTDITGGSHAAAKVHGNKEDDYVEAYATTINRAMRLLVKDFYKFNFPDDVKVPIPYWNPVPPTDATEEVQSLISKTQALDSLTKAISQLAGINNGEYLKLLDIEGLMKKINQ